MHVFLDHLASTLVLSVLVLIFVLVQFRGAQSNAESVVNHVVRSETLEIVETLERDIVNIRTQTQTQNAISAGNFTGGTVYNCGMTVNGDTTLAFTFPTLANPQAGDTASVALVNYVLIQVPGNSVSRMMGGVEVSHPLYRLERQIGTDITGISQSTVTYFNVDYFRDGVALPVLNGVCPADMDRIRFQLQMARPGIEEAAMNQMSRSQLNFSRYGATLDLVNWE